MSKMIIDSEDFVKKMDDSRKEAYELGKVSGICRVGDWLESGKTLIEFLMKRDGEAREYLFVNRRWAQLAEILGKYN